jgi:hypothetical protein
VCITDRHSAATVSLLANICEIDARTLEFTLLSLRQRGLALPVFAAGLTLRAPLAQLVLVLALFSWTLVLEIEGVVGAGGASLCR